MTGYRFVIFVLRYLYKPDRDIMSASRLTSRLTKVIPRGEFPESEDNPSKRMVGEGGKISEVEGCKQPFTPFTPFTPLHKGTHVRVQETHLDTIHRRQEGIVHSCRGAEP